MTLHPLSPDLLAQIDCLREIERRNHLRVVSIACFEADGPRRLHYSLLERVEREYEAQLWPGIGARFRDLRDLDGHPIHANSVTYQILAHSWNQLELAVKWIDEAPAKVLMMDRKLFECFCDPLVATRLVRLKARAYADECMALISEQLPILTSHTKWAMAGQQVPAIFRRIHTTIGAINHAIDRHPASFTDVTRARLPIPPADGTSRSDLRGIQKDFQALNGWLESVRSPDDPTQHQLSMERARILISGVLMDQIHHAKGLSAISNAMLCEGIVDLDGQPFTPSHPVLDLTRYRAALLLKKPNPGRISHQEFRL